MTPVKKAAARPQRRPTSTFVYTVRRRTSIFLPLFTIYGADVTTDDEIMGTALEEAALALVHDDVPVGAVVVVGGAIVARRHNEREARTDPTAHAEILAIADAAAVAGSWRLSDATLYVTLEPCPMCAGALVAARLGRLVFGAPDLKAGSCGSLYNICADPRLNHEVPITAGVRAEESAALLREFFAERRPPGDTI